MLNESLRQWDEEMRWWDEVMRQQDEAMRQRDDFYAQAFAQQQISFRLVDLTISFAIEHLAILSKLHCITTCIANGAAARNPGAAVPASPTTTSLRVTSWSSGTFSIISVFQLIHFDVVYLMTVFHTPSSGHSQLNEFDGTSRGSSSHSNHPKDDDDAT
jgi:hypothetical protein